MIDESLIGKRKDDEERLASLPAHLRERTDEQKQQDLENQKKWAKSVASPFIKGSPQEVALARSLRLEDDWRKTATDLLGKLAFAVDDDKIESLNNAYRNACLQLGEALYTQGRFEEAAKWVAGFNRDLEAEYLAMHAALERDDEEACGSECNLAFAADATRLTQEDIVAEVFSPKHNAIVPVFRCNHCNGMNARPFTERDRPHLKRREMRKQALALTQGQSPRAAAETLAREGLTTEKAFA